MVKRILYGLLLASLLGLCYLGYTNYRQKRAMTSGEVFGGPSESTSTDPSVALPEPSPAISRPFATSPAKTPATSAPTSDTMPPNPPNGMAYSGSGRFQVYRQGNLTYRINTDTGQSCVLYATNEEWRKAQVYSHGCATSAAH